jgi:hypothetical protein
MVSIFGIEHTGDMYVLLFSNKKYIGFIYKYINNETYKTLVQDLTISRQDKGNILLYNHVAISVIH